jgi:hypothetical protein
MARGSSRAESEAPKRRKNLREGSIKERVGDVNNEERSAALASRISATGLPKTGPTHLDAAKTEEDMIEKLGGYDKMGEFTKEQWAEIFGASRAVKDASFSQDKLDTFVKDVTNGLALGEILSAKQRKDFKPIDDEKLRITDYYAGSSGVSQEEKIAFFKEANRLGLDLVKSMVRPERLTRAEIDDKVMAIFEGSMKAGNTPGYSMALLSTAAKVATSQIEMAKYGKPDDASSPRFSYVDLKDGNTYIVAPQTKFKPSLNNKQISEAVVKGGLPPRISY